jgi:hypothetical protein
MEIIKTVADLIRQMERCDPDAEVALYYNDKIAWVMEVGGDSHKSKQVRLMTDMQVVQSE